MQPPPTPANPLTEIAAFVIAALLIVAGALLLFAQRIDFAGATSIFVLAVGILAANIALKAPSPSQQAQIQGIITQVMAVIPAALAHAQQPTPIVIHNNLPPAPNPPTATVPTVPVAAAAQPAPVQITPNHAWETSVVPLSGGVQQQPFPPSTIPKRFDTQQPPAVSG